MAKQDTGIVDIHGKQYQTVAYRVSKFREDHKDFSLETEIVYRDETEVVMKATISVNGLVIATGHAEEQRKSSHINKTSALENAETSAIGRCLAAFGLGGTEFASADEVANAIHQQNAPQQQYKSPPPSEPKKASPAREIVNSRIKEALSVIYGNDTDKKKQALIDATTFDSDGRTITGKSDYRTYSGKQAEIVAKELEKQIKVEQLNNSQEAWDAQGETLI